MYGRVKQLRQRGKRMSDREIASASFLEGDLVVHGIGGVIMAELKQPNTQVGEPLLVLYEARLITMHSSSMLLKGDERPQGKDGPAYVQEWSVRFDQR